MLDLAARLRLFKESPIRTIAEMLVKARGDPEIISFGGGEPSLDPPIELLDFLDEELRLDPHHASTYSTTQGMLGLRFEIADDLRREGVTTSPENIVITIGSTEAIYLALQALVNPGEEVILIDPTYVSYQPAAALSGARVRWVPTSVKKDFQLDLEKVKAAVTKKTKALVLLTPDNPTGRILAKDVVKGIANLATDKKFYIISDETYKDIVFEGAHHSPTKWTDNAIACCSFSKVASAPGFREGYLYSQRSDVIKAILKIKQFVSLCSVTPAQLMLTRFYEKGVKEKYLRQVVLPTYKKRRDVMIRETKKNLPEAKFVPPAGAFYLFADLSAYLKRARLSDGEFSDALFRKKKVAVVPGHFFGPSGERHVRFTFVSEPEARIKEGIERIVEFVS